MLVVLFESTVLAQGACAIRFHVVNSFGEAIPYEVVSFVNQVTGAEERARFRESLCGTNLPRGIYSYALAKKGTPEPGRMQRGTVSIGEGARWITIVSVGLTASSGHKEGSIDLDFGKVLPRGRVVPSPEGDEPVWIRCQSAYSNHAIEAAISRDGTFSLPEVLVGRYVVIVLQGDHTLLLTEWTFRPEDLLRPIELVRSR